MPHQNDYCTYRPFPYRTHPNKPKGVLFWSDPYFIFGTTSQYKRYYYNWVENNMYAKGIRFQWLAILRNSCYKISHSIYFEIVPLLHIVWIKNTFFVSLNFDLFVYFGIEVWLLSNNLEPYETIIASKGSLYPIMYLDNYMFCCRQWCLPRHVFLCQTVFTINGWYKNYYIWNHLFMHLVMKKTSCKHIKQFILQRQQMSYFES